MLNAQAPSFLFGQVGFPATTSANRCASLGPSGTFATCVYIPMQVCLCLLCLHLYPRFAQVPLSSAGASPSHTSSQ